MPKRVYTCAHAAIQFHAPRLDPLLITQVLRLPADNQHRPGEPRLMRSFKGKVNEYSPYDSGLWSMSSKNWVRSTKLSTHLNWLLDELEPRANEIQSLDVVDLEKIFFCFSAGFTSAPPGIPGNITRRASSLGVRIEIDHYDTTGDDHPD